MPSLATTRYLIHEFTLEDTSAEKKIDIFQNEFHSGFHEKRPLLSTKYEKMIGPSNFPIQSLFLQLNRNTYMFIGRSIFIFETSQNNEIEKFFSSIGPDPNSYSYAVGKKYMYYFYEDDLHHTHHGSHPMENVTILVPSTRVRTFDMDGYEFTRGVGPTGAASRELATKPHSR